VLWAVTLMSNTLDAKTGHPHQFWRQVVLLRPLRSGRYQRPPSRQHCAVFRDIRFVAKYSAAASLSPLDTFLLVQDWVSKEMGFLFLVLGDKATEFVPTSRCAAARLVSRSPQSSTWAASTGHRYLRPLGLASTV
jgi:hypothetical protein